jgi:uncharacterized caspase-like protein
VTVEELMKSSLLKPGEIGFPDLAHAAEDADRFVRSFQPQEHRAYDHVIATTLCDKHATAPALRDALREVADKAKPEDVVVVFFSGHGVVDPKVGFYLATYEADPKTPATTALTGKELSTLLEGIKARTILALDTCHSAGAFGGTRLERIVTSPNDLTGLVNELSSAEEGTIVLSSSAATEESLEDLKGGLFTQAFCEGLARKSAGSNPSVTCRGMQDWLIKRVPELVDALFKGRSDVSRQTPVCIIPKGVPDFPLATPVEIP